MLRMAWTIDLTAQANIPLEMDVYVSKVVAFEACLSVVRVGMQERGIDRCAMDGSGGINFVMELRTLEGQLGVREKQGGRHGGRNL